MVWRWWRILYKEKDEKKNNSKKHKEKPGYRKRYWDSGKFYLKAKNDDANWADGDEAVADDDDNDVFDKYLNVLTG